MIRTETVYDPVGLVLARDYERCCATICRHVSNDRYYGQPFLLAQFQRENIWKPIFACGELADGRFKRRYRRAIIGMPSGYGKTELAAALVLTIATMEVTYNGQYGVVASSKDQVRNIFDKMASMISLSDILREQWSIGKNIITHKETGAKVMVLPNKADALESWHFNVLVFDELHTYRDAGVWAAGLKGQKVLPNALSIGITTAANSREGFLWDTLQAAQQDAGLYVYWLGLDDGDDIESREAWEKMMVAPWITWEDVQDQRQMASSKRAFERYTANRFPSNRDVYSCFTVHQLDACAGDNEFDFTKPYTIGIDGAVSGDSFAIVAYQKRDGVGYTHEWVFDTPDEETGHYDMAQIMELLAGICQRNWPQVVGIDPSRLMVFASQMEDIYGIAPVAFNQTNATMCQATSLVVQAVGDASIRVDRASKLRQHLLNTIEEVREPYGTRFGKDSRKSKIDAAIALAIAVLAWEKLVAVQDGLVPVF